MPIRSPVHRLGLEDFNGQLWLVFGLSGFRENGYGRDQNYSLPHGFSSIGLSKYSAKNGGSK
jgi:hypothetical protein